VSRDDLRSPFRGLGRSKRASVPSPARRDRHGVAVTYRVLSGRMSSGALGSRARHGLGTRDARPSRCSSVRPRPRERPPGQSSRGVRLSCTVQPLVPARSRGDVSRHRRAGTSRGVRFPSNAFSSASPRPGVASRFCRRVPPRRLRCRSRALSAPQRPCSSPCLPAIFRRVAFLGFRPSGVRSSIAAAAAHRRLVPS